MKIETVTCFGRGTGAPGQFLYDEMVKVGKLLAENKITVVTGAYGGIGMEAPAKGACSVGGEVVGYHLGLNSINRANQYLTKSHDSSFAGYGGGAPPDPPQYHGFFDSYFKRLKDLLTSDAFVIAGDMSLGTLVEIFVAANLNEKDSSWKQRRIALLGASSSDVEIVSILHTVADSSKKYLRITATAKEAVDWVLKKT